jgi:hypothetical protein
MSSKKKEHKVDDRAKKATYFFITCQANPATKVKVRIKVQDPVIPQNSLSKRSASYCSTSDVMLLGIALEVQAMGPRTPNATKGTLVLDFCHKYFCHYPK